VIGTCNMNSGSVAMIISQHSAILTHIPPQPWPTLDPHTGDANTERMMNRVRLYYDHYRAFYPTASAHVVCALHNSTVGLEGQLRITIGRFREMHLATAQIHHYNVPVARTAGTVVVLLARSMCKTDWWPGSPKIPRPEKREPTATTMQESPAANPMGPGSTTRTTRSSRTPSMHQATQGFARAAQKSREPHR
jgi:hypothetical protein